MTESLLLTAVTIVCLGGAGYSLEKGLNFMAAAFLILAALSTAMVIWP